MLERNAGRRRRVAAPRIKGVELGAGGRAVLVGGSGMLYVA